MTTCSVQSSAELRRLRWQCRRGMLELDLLLGNFVERVGETLSSDQQKVLVALLGLPDQTLHDWLVGGLAPTDSRFCALVDRIRRGNFVGS